MYLEKNMIKTTTKVRCDKCGKLIYTTDGDHRRVKANFRAFGWTFPGDKCYCKECSKDGGLRPMIEHE